MMMYQTLILKHINIVNGNELDVPQVKMEQNGICCLIMHIKRVMVRS